MKNKHRLYPLLGKCASDRWSQTAEQVGFLVALSLTGSNAGQSGPVFFKDILERLSVAKISGLRELDDFCAFLSEDLASGSLMVVKINQTKISIAGRGAGAVYLCRNGKIGLLYRGAGPIEGDLSKNDKLLLLSGGFAPGLSLDQLSILRLSVEEAVEKMRVLLHSDSGFDGSAGLLWDYDGGKALFFPEILRRWFFFINKARFVKLLLIIIFSTAFSFRVYKMAGKENSRLPDTQINDSYEKALHKYEEGRAVAQVNSAIGRKSLLESKKEVLDLMPKIREDNPLHSKLLSLIKSLNAALGESLNNFKITQPEVFFDLELIKSGASGSLLNLSGDDLFFYDKNAPAIYRLNINSKTAGIAAGSESLKEVLRFAGAGRTLFFLEAGGIKGYNLDSRNFFAAIGKDENWGEPLGIAAYAGNLYVLDVKKGKIWKHYPATGRENETEAFMPAQSYLDENSVYDFSGADSFIIDGQIWVSAGDKIYKFGSGRQMDFAVSGLDQPLGRSLLLSAGGQTEYLYVLDRENSRVIAFDKRTGAYQSQFYWEGIKNISGIAVKGKDKEILLLGGSKIYSIKMS